MLPPMVVMPIAPDAGDLTGRRAAATLIGSVAGGRGDVAENDPGRPLYPHE